MSVLAPIAILALLILVHELGHFLAARSQGIHVNRFSLGFGPILLKYQGKETEYAIRAFPLGGFVGFPDDDPDSTIPANDPNLLRNRPILDRAIVISAGVIANLVFAYLVLALQFSSVGVLQAHAPGVLLPALRAEVVTVDEAAQKAGIKPGDVFYADGKTLQLAASSGEPAELVTIETGKPLKLAIERDRERQEVVITPVTGPDGKGRLGVQILPTVAIRAGLRPGDVVLAANGQQFDQSLGVLDQFRQLIRANPNQSVQLLVQRGEQQLNLTVMPETTANSEPQIGVVLASNGGKEYHRPSSVFTAFSLAAEEFQRIVTLTLQGFGQLLSNFQKTANQVAGPVAIVAIGADIANRDAASLFQFAALISINLAIINILPLPALDGGQLAFLFIEGLRGKPIPDRIQESVMQTGLVLLLGLGIFLIIRDTANLWIR